MRSFGRRGVWFISLALLSLLAPAAAEARVYSFEPVGSARSFDSGEGSSTLKFRVGRLAGTEIHSARLRLGRAGRRLPVRKLRAAARRGVLRLRATSAARAKPDKAKLRVVAYCRPAFGTFEAGRWPSACWRPYSSRSPFNRLIPSKPRLLPDSAAVVRRMTGWGDPYIVPAGLADTSRDWNHPTYYSRPGDPVFKLNCTRWCHQGIDGDRIHIPDRARPAAGGDGHMTVVDQDGKWEYSFWQVTSKSKGGGTMTFEEGGRGRVNGSGLGYGPTAAQFGTLAGIVRGPELLAGRINHALFLTVDCSNGRAVYPAGNNPGAACSETDSAPPMGARLQLAMSDAQIDSLSMPAWKTAILRALARYGAYVGDTGGSPWDIAVESGSTYTSFGVEDPLVKLGRRGGADIDADGGVYHLNIGRGVDWGRYLRVVDPCVTRRSC
jgi:hypothetical protein